MNKRKKLVRVGWGIVLRDHRLKADVCLDCLTVQWTRTEAITKYNYYAREARRPLYKELRRKGFAIAKRLWVWVEVE